jgi:cytochrome c nitrite reductase small subunit
MSGQSKVVLTVAILVGALLLGGVAIPLTNHPTFCASCHNIRPSHDTWLASTHKTVTCVDCHVRPGVNGFLHDKVYAGLKDVAIYVFATPTEAHNLEGPVATQVCYGCHQAILRVSEIATRDLPLPVKEVGLMMSHRKHMEAFEKRGQGEGCTTCHSRVVHEKPIKGYPIIIPRGHVSADDKPYHPDYPEGSLLWKKALRDCFSCHDGKATYDGKVLSRKCDTCHIPEKIARYLDQ